MSLSWSPHPRYRLYTTPHSYTLPFRSVPAGCVADLELEICRRFNVAAAVCVPMARTGLYFALSEIIRPGQKVVMSPLTIVDVVNAVLLAGGIPVFADIVRESCAIDPDQTESLIDSRTGAVLITHLHGCSAGAIRFDEICRRRGVALIEDAAQAFGAIEKDRRLGTIGDLGIYSFGFYKNLTAWQGGMLVSDNLDLIARIRRRMSGLRNLSRGRLLTISTKGLLTDLATWPPLFATAIHPFVRSGLLDGLLDPERGAPRLKAMPKAYLANMSPVQASMARLQLDRVDRECAVRVANAASYHDAFCKMDSVITPSICDGLSNVYTAYPIQVAERDKLLRYAHARGRDLAPQTLRNCADLAQFSEFHRECPNARAASRELIVMPTYPRYPRTEIHRNIEIVQEFLKNARQ